MNVNEMSVNVVTGGGVVGLLLALSYVGKLLLDWYKTPTPPRSAQRKDAAAVTDAQAANAVLTASLLALQGENGRLVHRVEVLEDEAALKDAKVAELERRLNSIAAELAQLRHTGTL